MCLNMKRLHVIHEYLINIRYLLNNESCQVGKFCPLLRRHVFPKLMDTVRLLRAGLHSYGAQDFELSPDPPEARWSHAR